MGKVDNGDLIVYAVLLLAVLVAIPQCHAGEFHVEGRVYCDTCRVQFETRISEPLEGAEVELRCKCRDSGKPTAYATGKSDNDGKYMLTVVGDYEKDICEVTVLSSPREDCSDPMDEHARIVCTKNIGITSNRRYANAIGYMKREALPECKLVLDEMGFIPVHE